MSLGKTVTGSGASLMAIDRGVLQLTDTSVVFEMAGQSGIATGVITAVGAGAGVTYIGLQMGLGEEIKSTVDDYRN